jgi:enoyl-CoA hydratase/carnithine racemase
VTGGQVTDQLAQLWRVVEHVAQARLTVLDDALRALQEQAPDAAQRSAAAFEECHKLVGSLDSWGRAGGSALALQAAQELALPQPDADVLADVLTRLRRTVDGPAP